MGDNINIDWSAGANMNPEGPLGAVNSGYKGAAIGYDLGQKAAVIHALHGIDLNSPQSVDAGIGNLVRANAGEQASALQNLTFTRSLRQQIPTVISAIVNALSGQATGQTSGQSSPAPAQAAAADQPVADPQHVIQTWNMAKGSAEGLMQVPVAERPEAFAEIKQKMLARGIPEQAIDAAGDDLSDAGLKSLSDHYGELIAHAQHQMNPQGEAPPVPAAHPSNTWYNNAVNNPAVGLGVGMLKSSGLDLSPFLDMAEKLAQPEINKAAELKYAGPIAASQAGVDIAKQQALMPIEAQKAGMVASAELAARSPGEFVQVQGQSGQPVWVRKDFAMGYAAGHGGVLGQGIAPAEQAFKTGQAGQTAEFLKPDPVARNAAADTQANAERALSIISTLKLDATTPVKAQIASALRAAGVKNAEAYANDIAGYQQATTQALAQGTHDLFPQRTTNTDLKLMHDVFPTLKTPNDAAAIAMGTLAAKAVRAQEFEDFKASYSGPHGSPKDVYKAWLSGPGGQSIFQSPEWGKVTLGGRPAFNPATDIKTVDGVKVGAWGIGTGHPVYFPVK